MMTQSHQSNITERFCSRYSTGKRDFLFKKLRKNRKLPPLFVLAFATFAFVFVLAFSFRQRQKKSKKDKNYSKKGNNLFVQRPQIVLL
jgi:hypothetical protein